MIVMGFEDKTMDGNDVLERTFGSAVRMDHSKRDDKEKMFRSQSEGSALAAPGSSAEGASQFVPDKSCYFFP